MLTEKLTNFFDWTGAEWVMYILIVLSVASVIIMVERWLFYRRSQVDVEALRRALAKALDADDHEAALKVAESHHGMEGRVLAEGIRYLDKGPGAVEEVVSGTIGLQRQVYEKNLPFLGTLGNNAPFIGLFGTVLGIIGAFDRLESTGEGVDRTQAIMGDIAEALVATAVGLMVAIPAVIAYNQFKGTIKGRAAQANALSRVLLAHMKSLPSEEA